MLIGTVIPIPFGNRGGVSTPPPFDKFAYMTDCPIMSGNSYPSYFGNTYLMPHEGRALHFNGTNQCAAYADPAGDLDLIKFPTHFFTSGWVKLSNDMGFGYLWGKDEDRITQALYSWGLRREPHVSKISWNIRTHRGALVIESNDPVPIEEWTHVAVYQDMVARRMYLYINGVLQHAGGVSYMGQFFENANCEFAVANANYDSGGVMMDSTLITVRDIRIYDTDQRTHLPAIMAGESVGDPIAWWTCEEHDAPCVPDRSGNERHMRKVHFDDTSYVSGDWPSVMETIGEPRDERDTVVAQPGRAMQYNGVDQYSFIHKPGLDVIDTPTGEFWLTANIKTPDTLGPLKLILGKNVVAVPVGRYGIYLVNDTFYTILIYDGGSIYVASQQVSANTWYNVAMRADLNTNTLSLYLDGVLQGSGAIAGPLATVDRNYEFLFGAGSSSTGNNYAYYSDVALHDIRIYHKDIEANLPQIINHQTTRLGDEVAWWFMECTGDALIDSSGNNWHGKNYLTTDQSFIEGPWENLTDRYGYSLKGVEPNNLLVPVSEPWEYEYNDTSNWTVFGANIVEQDGKWVKITYVNNAYGASNDVRFPAEVYAQFNKCTCDIEIEAYINDPTRRVNITCYDGANYNVVAQVTKTTPQTFKFRQEQQLLHPYFRFIQLGAGDIIWFRVKSIQFYYDSVIPALVDSNSPTLDAFGNELMFPGPIAPAAVKRNVACYTGDGTGYWRMGSAINLNTNYSASVRMRLNGGSSADARVFEDYTNIYTTVLRVNTGNIIISNGNNVSWAWTNDDEEHHFLAVCDGVNAELFIDGVSQGTRTFANAVPVTISSIGGNQTGVLQNGYIYDARLYARSLGCQEIAKVVKGDVLGDEILNYPFCEGAGIRAHDVSTYGPNIDLNSYNISSANWGRVDYPAIDHLSVYGVTIVEHGGQTAAVPYTISGSSRYYPHVLHPAETHTNYPQGGCQVIPGTYFSFPKNVVPLYNVKANSTFYDSATGEPLAVSWSDILNTGYSTGEWYIDVDNRDKFIVVDGSATITPEEGVAIDKYINLKQKKEYSAIYDAMTIKPPAMVAEAQNTFVEKLILAGIWDKLDVLLMFSSHTSANDEHLIDWITPSRKAAQPVPPKFVPYGGIEGNGVDQYIDTGYNPTTDGVKYQLNDCSTFIGVRTNEAESAYDYGARSNPDGWSIGRTRRDNNQVNAYINTNTISVLGTTDDSRKHYCFTRTANNVVNGYLNSSKTVDSEVSASLPNQPFYICGYNNDGTLTYETRKRYLYWGAGAALTDSEWNTFYTEAEKLLTVTHAGIIVSNETAYPAKRPMISWMDDDGWDDGITFLKAKLDQYNYKAGFAVPLDAIGVVNHLTGSQIRELNNEGHEILSHSTTAASLTSLTESEIVTALVDSKDVLEALIGVDVNNFVYPGGNWNTIARDQVTKIYRTARGVTGECKWPQEYGNLDGFGIDTTSLADLQAAVDDAITNNKWLILYGHSHSWDAAKRSEVETLIDYIHTQGVDFKTINEGLDVIEKYHPNRWLPEHTLDNIVDMTTFNSLISHVAENHTVRLSRSYELTGDITLPAEITLEFTQGGQITGAHTITGDNTVIQAAAEPIFGPNVSFAGTFNCNQVYPEWFGAAISGNINDNVAFDKTIELANLTSSRKIQLQNKEYYTNNTLELKNLILEGGGGTLKRSGSNSIVVAGEHGTYVNLTESADEGNTWIKVPASFASTVEVGDLVKILSDEICIPSASENVRYGEMHKISEISGTTIYFHDSLFHGYTTADNARVAKVIPAKGSITNVRIQYPSGSTANEVAINIMYSEDLVLDNVIVESAYRASIQSTDNYRIKINAHTFDSIGTGWGYGVTIGGASMYADVTGKFVGHRHCFTTTGSAASAGSDFGGVQWGTIVHDATAVPGLNGAACFDTHASSGSITYSNCIVYAGAHKDYENTPEWGATTSYSVGDRVSRNNFHYVCGQACLGQDPALDTASEYWEYRSKNVNVGFNMEGLSNYLSNCQVHGCNTGVNLYSTGNRDAYIDGLIVKDSVFGVLGPANNVTENVVIKNVVHKNAFNYLKAYTCQLSGEYTSLSIENIHSENCRPIFFSVNNNMPEDIVFTNITGIRENALNNTEDIAISLGVPIPKYYAFNNVYVKNMSVLRISSNNMLGPIDTVALNNVQHFGGDTYAFDIQQQCSRLAVSNFVNTPLDHALVYSKNGIEDVTITGNFSCRNLFAVLPAYGYVNTYSVQGGTTTDTNDYDFEGNIRGQNPYPIEKMGRRLLKGYSAPEGNVAANIGTMYIRRTNGYLYIKQTGSGNTGWVQIS